jgi:hypothetical protein
MTLLACITPLPCAALRLPVWRWKLRHRWSS